MNILIHGSIIGPGGIAHHIREFSKHLSKYHNIKIRNFNVDDKLWNGYTGPNVHDKVNELEPIHHKMLHLQSLWDNDELKDFHLSGYDEFFVPDLHLIMAEAHHYYYFNDYNEPVIAYFPWETTELMPKFLEKLKTFEYIWTPSTWQKNILINNGVDENKIDVVNEGVDPKKFKPLIKKNNKRLTFLHIGTWEYRKSTYEILKAFLNVVGDDPSVEFKLGIHNKFREQDTPEKTFEKYGLPINKNITFLGTLSEKEYVKEIQNADLYISCSRGEGWNLPLIQSISCGVPSIYSKCGGQLEFSKKSLGIGIDIKNEELAKRKISINDNDYYWELLHDYYPGNLYEPDYGQLELEINKFYKSYKLNKLNNYKLKSLEDSLIVHNIFNWEYIAEKSDKLLTTYNTKKPIKSMSNIYYLIHSTSFGDTLASTPTLRYLSQSHRNKINVVTHNKSVFNGNPYIENLLSFDDYTKLNKDGHVKYESFTFAGKPDLNGIEKKFSHMDIRQLHAYDLGFQLSPEQMSYDFYPNELELEVDLPEKYVVLHVTTNWPNRTWNDENWVKLIDWLRENKIFTVLIGSGYREELHKSYSDKPLDKYCPTFENVYGLDLTNKGTMSDMWWVINGSQCIVTMDSGPLHLAGCTNTNILQLGSAINPSFRAPYRYGQQDFNYYYVGGSCKLFCNSNLFYNVKEWGNVNSVPPMPYCLENKPSFECHPALDSVINTMKSILGKEEPNRFDTIVDLVWNSDPNNLNLNFKVNTKRLIRLDIIDYNTGLKRDSWTNTAKHIYTGNLFWAPNPGYIDGLGKFIIKIYLNDKYYGYKIVNANGDNYLNILDKTYKFDGIEDINYSTFWEIYINKDYEYSPEFNIKENDVVLDIGGNYGFFSMYALDKGASEVISVEPITEPFENIKKLSKDLPITPINKAVGNTDGEIKMILSKEVSARNCVSKYNNILNNDGEEIFVNSVNINTLFDDINKKINYAKIDCEGSEIDVFNTISDKNLKSIDRYCVETHGDDMQKIIIDKFLKSNFRVEVRDDCVFAKNLNS